MPRGPGEAAESALVFATFFPEVNANISPPHLRDTELEMQKFYFAAV